MTLAEKKNAQAFKLWEKRNAMHIKKLKIQIDLDEKMTAVDKQILRLCEDSTALYIREQKAASK